MKQKEHQSTFRFFQNLGRYNKFVLLIASLSLLFACNSSKKITRDTYTYFQNGLDSIHNIQVNEPVIQINDFLTIQVSSSSLNQEQTLPFKTPATAAGVQAGYLVNSSGEVELPVIGAVKAAGLTQLQLQKNITDKLIPYVKDPTVVIHFLQFKVNVLGEVKSPGTKKFDADRVTLIDAISEAGDLTDYGERNDVTIIREENNTRKVYKVDLKSGSMFQSPAYLLQSNDIVYVSAVDQKFKKLKSEASVGTYNVLRVISTILGLATSIILLRNLFN